MQVRQLEFSLWNLGIDGRRKLAAHTYPRHTGISLFEIMFTVRNLHEITMSMTVPDGLEGSQGTSHTFHILFYY